jgi:putative membrane protein
MRVIQAILFLIFLGAIGLFAVQNREVITISFWDRKIDSSIALMAIVAYVLGMLSGWTVVAFVRRSLRKVREHPQA